VSVVGVWKDVDVAPDHPLADFQDGGTGVAFRARRPENVYWLGSALNGLDYYRWLYWNNMKGCEVQNRVLYLEFPYRMDEDDYDYYSLEPYPEECDDYDSDSAEGESTAPATGA
jgi:hypothetical protein